MRKSEIWISLNGTSVLVSWKKGVPLMLVQFGLTLEGRHEVMPVKLFMQQTKNSFTRKVSGWGWVRV